MLVQFCTLTYDANSNKLKTQISVILRSKSMVDYSDSELLESELYFLNNNWFGHGEEDFRENMTEAAGECFESVIDDYDDE